MIFKNLLKCLCIVWPALCHGQSNSISFDKLTTRDGLPNSTVTSITQDFRGFMWIGTFTGLSRYDGTTLRNYYRDQNDSSALQSDRITCLLEDKNKNLWIGTHQGGLHLYDRKMDRFKNFAEGIESKEITAIFEDSHHNVWVGTSNGLSRWDTKSQSFKALQHPASIRQKALRVNSITEFRGVLEVLANDQQVYTPGARSNQLHLHPSVQQFENTLVKFLYRDRYENLWFAKTGKELVRQRSSQNPDQSQSHNFVVNADALVMREDRSGRLWIGTDNNGIGILDSSRNEVQWLEPDPKDNNSFDAKGVYTIYEDRAGSIWIGTISEGVFVYHPAKSNFQLYTHIPGVNSLSNSAVLAIVEDRQEQIWIGTDGGGLNLFNKKDRTFRHFRHSPLTVNTLSSDVVKSLCESRDGKLWIGTYKGGLNWMDPITKQITRVRSCDEKQNEALAIIWNICEDHEGHLWLSTLGHGMFRYDPKTSKFTQYISNIPGGLSDRNIFDIHEDADHAMWFGTENHGVNRLDADGKKIVSFNNTKEDRYSLSDNHAWTIFQDLENRIWVGTADGLNLYDKEHQFFSPTIQHDKLGGSIIVSIEEDGWGNLWLATGNGLVRYSKSSGKTKKYTELDGLQSDNFHMNASAKGADGMIYMGGPNGFNFFDPDAMRDNVSIPPVVFTGLNAFNEAVNITRDGMLTQSITETTAITISHRESFITFSFAALNFICPKKNRYAYRIKEISNEWILTDRPEVTCTNFSPGVYTLEVKAGNNDGYWNEQPATIILTVTPPWWRTSWFKALAVLFFSLLIFFLYRLRITHVKKLIQLRNEKQLMLYDAHLVQTKLEHEKQLVNMMNVKLEEEVEFKSAELAATILNVVKQNEILLKIRQDINVGIEQIEGNTTVSRHFKQIVRLICKQVEQDDPFEQFEKLFNQSHRNFLKKLKIRYPELTSRDLRFCAYLRMNLNSKEIATLLSMSVRSVEDVRYRVRKKLGIDSSVSLDNFILVMEFDD